MQTTSAQWPGCFCKKMSRSNTCKKLRKCAKNPSGHKQCITRFNLKPLHDPKDFLHEVQFSAAIEAAHFPAVFEMQSSLHSKKGPHSWGRP